MKAKLLKKFRSRYKVVNIAPFEYAVFDNKKKIVVAMRSFERSAVEWILNKVIGSDTYFNLKIKNNNKKLTNLAKQKL